MFLSSLRSSSIALALLPFWLAGGLCAQAPLPGTQALTTTENLSIQMVVGTDRFLDEQLAIAVENRARFWQPEFADRAAYE